MDTKSLQEAFEWSSGIVAQLDADQLDAATPCEGWTVRMLVNHMIGANRAFASGVPFGDVDPQCDPAVDLFTEEPGPVYDASWNGAVAAWSEVGADGTTTFPWGPMPNALAERLLFFESTVHGWDLLVATGQDPDVPGGLVASTQKFAAMMFADPANRGHDFAPPVPIDDDAPATARLMAYLGRRP